MEEMLEIKIHLDSQGVLPSKIKTGDWIDLRASRSLRIKEGSYVEIPLGVSMWLPEGYEAIVAPRSSTFKRYGLIMVNGIGVIDNSYNGTEDEWHFPAYCLRGSTEIRSRKTAYTIVNAGDRICQFRIQKSQPDFIFVTCDELNDTPRGGLGSTGIE